LINFAGIYLPISFSGRLVLGIIIPIILLAAIGLEDVVLPRVSSRMDRIAPSLRNLSLLFTIPSAIFFIFYFTITINSYEIYPFYQNQSEMEAAAWLAEITTDDDLLLAEFPLCNLFPRFGKGRVFNGHFDLTKDMDRKFYLSGQFWNPETSDQWREDFIAKWGVSYIYQGPTEAAHADGEIFDLPYEIIHETEDFRIYQVP
jgi:hypothetical protein